MKSLTRSTLLKGLARIWTNQSKYVSGAVNTHDVIDAKPFEDIPGPKGIYNTPLIGAMFHFKPFTDVTFETVHKMFETVMNKHGPIARVYLGEWCVFVEDPEDFGIVMKNEGKYPRRMDFLINSLFLEKTGAPKTVGDLQGEEWHKVRSPLNPLLMRAKSAQHYLPAQNIVADDLVERLKKPFQPEELQDLLYRYACESISVVTYNKRLGYLDVDIEPEKLQLLTDIRQIFTSFNESLRVPPFLLKHFPLKMKKDYFDAHKRLIKMTHKQYDETMTTIQQTKDKETGEKDSDKEHNFLLSLMTSDKVTAEGMTSIATSLFIAGTDSTARNLQNVLYNLARNPDKQQLLYDEIVRVIGPDGAVSEQSLDNMKYLFACVKESLRIIYPTPNGPQRYLPHDIVLRGYRIPAGTSVILMNQRAVKNPKYFPDPHSFLPERWLRGEGGKRDTPVPVFAHMPFSFGPRQCIGKRFAEQEMYLAVAKILQTFNVSLQKDQSDFEVVYNIFAGPKDPIKFIFTRRN